MSMLPVVAAIPNYNMARELKTLLPELLKQGYRQIFVLDDASTDNSREVVESFSGVVFVAGKTNAGAGANRNRIITAFSYDALIHFIDADTEVRTTDMAAKVQAAAPDEFGFIGGLSLAKTGKQSVWNYGPRPGFTNDYGALLQFRLGKLLATDEAAAKKFRTKHQKRLKAWPNPFATTVAQPVFWCCEQSIIFRSDIFKRYGGFDESLRETEISELSLRMAKDGLTGWFDPSFPVLHTEGQVRAYNRELRKRRETIKLAFQYGFWEWLRH